MISWTGQPERVMMRVAWYQGAFSPSVSIRLQELEGL